jgi:hypothetical protein
MLDEACPNLESLGVTHSQVVIGDNYIPANKNEKRLGSNFCLLSPELHRGIYFMDDFKIILALKFEIFPMILK